ncbi:hypothetical protein EVAR_96138_1 [Eumeta japonica]|uniref:Reverse transcriptase domain-containing protein n=1 Tax=Eumeta variegata TaxID=151549 RepID=A0A4C2A5Z8_EUMVA|nr:hypothetical protein EVAR_96138_1 [Eumeta japonica]
MGAFCGLYKAFDCVNHKTLIRKLHHYEVTGRAFDLLASYLTNSVQKMAPEAHSVFLCVCVKKPTKDLSPRTASHACGSARFWRTAGVTLHVTLYVSMRF